MTSEDPKAAKPAAKQSDAAADGAKIALAAVVGLVTTLVAALGVLTLTGTVGRVLRNEPAYMIVAVAILVAAGAIWVSADLVAARRKDEKRDVGRSPWRLKYVAVVLAVVGFSLGIWRAIDTADERSQPAITAAVDPKAGTLDATVEVAQLKLDATVAVFVDGMKDGELALEHVYQAFVGPDVDGKVEHGLTFGIPDGVDALVIRAFTEQESGECEKPVPKARAKTQKGTGCVTIPVDPAAIARADDEDDEAGAGGDSG